MPILVLSLFRFVRLLLSGHVGVAMESAALRVQLVALQRKPKRPTLTSFDRLSWVGLSLSVDKTPSCVKRTACGGRVINKLCGLRAC
jgi:hypothetical protein